MKARETPRGKVLRAKAPRVTVIMPVYNAAATLAQAVESIRRQSFRDWELVAVDDASRDESLELLQAFARRDPRIRVAHNRKNLKMGGTLNRCIRLAQGEYLVRMDADDQSLPERLALQVAYMDTHPEVGISGGAMEIVDPQGRKIGIRRYALTDAEIRKHLFHYSPFSHPTVILRRSALRRAGAYNPAWNPADDYELYFRLGRVAAFGNLPEIVLRYRVAPGSMTTGGTRTMERLTLQIRLKAVRELGYRMRWFDRVYWAVQWLSMHLMPGSWRLQLFKTVRGWLHTSERTS